MQKLLRPFPESGVCPRCSRAMIMQQRFEMLSGFQPQIGPIGRMRSTEIKRKHSREFSST